MDFPEAIRSDHLRFAYPRTSDATSLASLTTSEMPTAKFCTVSGALDLIRMSALAGTIAARVVPGIELKYVL